MRARPRTCRWRSFDARMVLTVRTSWVNENAGVLEVVGSTGIECQRRIWRLADRFRFRPGVQEVVPGMNNLTVELDQDAPDLRDLLQALRAGWDESAGVRMAGRRIEIPVEYGGAAGCDLDEVARHAGLSREEVVRL